MLVPLHVAGGVMCGRKRDGAPFVFHPKGHCGDGSQIPYFHPQISEEGTSSAVLWREQDYREHQAQLGLHQLALEFMNVHSRKGISQQSDQDRRPRSYEQPFAEPGRK
jgi:hypothetical protein